MSKRSNSFQSEDRLKRHQTRPPRFNEYPSDRQDESMQALIRLAEKADELANCLKSLKRQFSQNESTSEVEIHDTKRRLSQLSSNLLPSFQVLASVKEPSHGASGSPFNGEQKILEASQTPSSVPIPPAGYVTPWVSSEIRSEWPALPPILDASLAEEAFTHPGQGGKRSYERLEWLGDAYLELIATGFIHQTFGDLPSGRCSQLRERLIRNVTLAEYFRHYGMERWAKLPDDLNDREFGRGRSKDKDPIKVQADMFEAYIAAVILSDPKDGLAKVIEWLKSLWGRAIKDDVKKAEAEARRKEMMNSAAPVDGNAKPPEVSAKEKLSVKLAVKGVAIRYKDLPCEKKDKNLKLPLFSVGAYLDGWGETGRLLAVGTALSKKEAGQKAAETALQNKRLIKVYEEKKKAYLEARENNS